MSRTLGERQNPSGIGKETAAAAAAAAAIELRARCGVREHWVLGK